MEILLNKVCVILFFLLSIDSAIIDSAINPKFQASSHILWQYSLVCVGVVGNPEDRFSRDAANII